MGKQVLTHERVELIKYLIHTKDYTPSEINELFGVQPSNISKIKHNIRWIEVETPTEKRGHFLFNHFFPYLEMR